MSLYQKYKFQIYILTYIFICFILIRNLESSNNNNNLRKINKNIDNKYYISEIKLNSDKVFDKILDHLFEKEYIIKKAFENNFNSYNVAYITNYGNIIYSSISNNNIDPVKIIECNNNNELSDYNITKIINYNFYSNHYNKLKKELNNILI